ncbi:mucin-2-like isoform X2 [Acipenser ruthenus]|nr:mucin-2-like isoform X2 [Acipenser ruthenus]
MLQICLLKFPLLLVLFLTGFQEKAWSFEGELSTILGKQRSKDLSNAQMESAVATHHLPPLTKKTQPLYLHFTHIQQASSKISASAQNKQRTAKLSGFLPNSRFRREPDFIPPAADGPPSFRDFTTETHLAMLAAPQPRETGVVDSVEMRASEHISLSGELPLSSWLADSSYLKMAKVGHTNQLCTGIHCPQKDNNVPSQLAEIKSVSSAFTEEIALAPAFPPALDRGLSVDQDTSVSDTPNAKMEAGPLGSHSKDQKIHKTTKYMHHKLFKRENIDFGPRLENDVLIPMFPLPVNIEKVTEGSSTVRPGSCHNRSHKKATIQGFPSGQPASLLEALGKSAGGLSLNQNLVVDPKDEKFKDLQYRRAIAVFTCTSNPSLSPNTSHKTPSTQRTLTNSTSTSSKLGSLNVAGHMVTVSSPTESITTPTLPSNFQGSIATSRQAEIQSTSEQHNVWGQITTSNRNEETGSPDTKSTISSGRSTVSAVPSKIAPTISAFHNGSSTTFQGQGRNPSPSSQSTSRKTSSTQRTLNNATSASSILGSLNNAGHMVTVSSPVESITTPSLPSNFQGSITTSRQAEIQSTSEQHNVWGQITTSNRNEETGSPDTKSTISSGRSTVSAVPSKIAPTISAIHNVSSTTFQGQGRNPSPSSQSTSRKTSSTQRTLNNATSASSILGSLNNAGHMVTVSSPVESITTPSLPSNFQGSITTSRQAEIQSTSEQHNVWGQITTSNRNEETGSPDTKSTISSGRSTVSAVPSKIAPTISAIHNVSSTTFQGQGSITVPESEPTTDSSTAKSTSVFRLPQSSTIAASTEAYTQFPLVDSLVSTASVHSGISKSSPTVSTSSTNTLFPSFQGQGTTQEPQSRSSRLYSSAAFILSTVFPTMSKTTGHSKGQTFPRHSTSPVTQWPAAHSFRGTSNPLTVALPATPTTWKSGLSTQPSMTTHKAMPSSHSGMTSVLAKITGFIRNTSVPNSSYFVSHSTTNNILSLTTGQISTTERSTAMSSILDSGTATESTELWTSNTATSTAPETSTELSSLVPTVTSPTSMSDRSTTADSVILRTLPVQFMLGVAGTVETRNMMSENQTLERQVKATGKGSTLLSESEPTTESSTAKSTSVSGVLQSSTIPISRSSVSPNTTPLPIRHYTTKTSGTQEMSGPPTSTSVFHSSTSIFNFNTSDGLSTLQITSGTKTVFSSTVHTLSKLLPELSKTTDLSLKQPFDTDPTRSRGISEMGIPVKTQPELRAKLTTWHPRLSTHSSWITLHLMAGSQSGDISITEKLPGTPSSHSNSATSDGLSTKSSTLSALQGQPSRKTATQHVNGLSIPLARSASPRTRGASLSPLSSLTTLDVGASTQSASTSVTAKMIGSPSTPIPCPSCSSSHSAARDEVSPKELQSNANKLFSSTVSTLSAKLPKVLYTGSKMTGPSPGQAFLTDSTSEMTSQASVEGVDEMRHESLLSMFRKLKPILLTRSSLTNVDVLGTSQPVKVRITSRTRQTISSSFTSYSAVSNSILSQGTKSRTSKLFSILGFTISALQRQTFPTDPNGKMTTDTPTSGVGETSNPLTRSAGRLGTFISMSTQSSKIVDLMARSQLGSTSVLAKMMEKGYVLKSSSSSHSTSHFSSSPTEPTETTHWTGTSYPLKSHGGLPATWRQRLSTQPSQTPLDLTARSQSGHTTVMTTIKGSPTSTPVPSPSCSITQEPRSTTATLFSSTAYTLSALSPGVLPTALKTTDYSQVGEASNPLARSAGLEQRVSNQFSLIDVTASSHLGATSVTANATGSPSSPVQSSFYSLPQSSTSNGPSTPQPSTQFLIAKTIPALLLPTLLPGKFHSVSQTTDHLKGLTLPTDPTSKVPSLPNGQAKLTSAIGSLTSTLVPTSSYLTSPPTTGDGLSIGEPRSKTSSPGFMLSALTVKHSPGQIFPTDASSVVTASQSVGGTSNPPTRSAGLPATFTTWKAGQPPSSSLSLLMSVKAKATGTRTTSVQSSTHLVYNIATAPVKALPLQFRLSVVDARGTRKKAYKKKNLERQIKATMDWAFTRQYDGTFLETRIHTFFNDSLATVHGEVVFRQECQPPTSSDIVRTIVTYAERLPPGGAPWKIDIWSVESNGFSLTNLLPEKLSVRFITLQMGLASPGLPQSRFDILQGLSNKVEEAIQFQYPVQKFIIDNVRNVRGDLEVEGAVFLNTRTHVNSQDILRLLYRLANQSVDLTSLNVNGIGADVQIVPLNFRILNRKYETGLLDRTSKYFNALGNEAGSSVYAVLKLQYKTLMQVVIRKFTKGSVILMSDLVFAPPAPTPKAVLDSLLDSIDSNESLGGSALHVDRYSVIAGGVTVERPFKDQNVPGYGVAIIVMCGLVLIGAPFLILAVLRFGLCRASKGEAAGNIERNVDQV